MMSRLLAACLRPADHFSFIGSLPDYANGSIQTVATNADGSASTSVFNGVTVDGYIQVMNTDTSLELGGVVAINGMDNGWILLAGGNEAANLIISGSVSLTGDGTGTIVLTSSNDSVSGAQAQKKG